MADDALREARLGLADVGQTAVPATGLGFEGLTDRGDVPRADGVESALFWYRDAVGSFSAHPAGLGPVQRDAVAVAARQPGRRFPSKGVNASRKVVAPGHGGGDGTVLLVLTENRVGHRGAGVRLPRQASRDGSGSP